MSTLATTDDGDVVVGLGVVAFRRSQLVPTAWSSVLIRSRVARRPLVRMAVWLYGGLTEGYFCFRAWFDSGSMFCDCWVLMSCSQFLRDGGLGS